MSRPSTLPTNRMPDSSIRRYASLARSLPFPGSSPTLRSPTRASPSNPKYLFANTPPRIAKFNRSCGLQETVAPASSSRTREGKGSTVAIAGLRHPSRRPILSNAAATVAPVLPAEKNASASPSRTIPAATATLASGWALIAAEGSSSIPTACPEDRSEMLAGGSGPTSGSMESGSPTSNNSSRGSPSAAERAPAMISCGALSPPRASTAIRTGRVYRGLDVLHGDHRAALVETALGTYPVRHVRPTAVGASDETRASDRVVRPALVSARPGRLLLGNGHENTSWLLLTQDRVANRPSRPRQRGSTSPPAPSGCTGSVPGENTCIGTSFGRARSV